MRGEVEKDITKEKVGVRSENENGGPENIIRLKLCLAQNKTAENLRVRKYRAEQQTFLDEYMSTLVEVSIIRQGL